MAAGGHYTQEHQYFCRYFRLICEVGSKTMRKVVEVQLAKDGYSNISAFLNDRNIKKQIGFLENRKVIQQYQLDILYPVNGTATDLSLWDTTLLCTILKNTFKLSKPQKRKLDTIRELRNALSHGSPSMDSNEFASKWQDANNSISVILNLCNDANFTREITQTIHNIKSGEIEVGPTIKLFHDIVANLDHVASLSGQVATGNESIKAAIFANTKTCLNNTNFLEGISETLQKLVNERHRQNDEPLQYATTNRKTETGDEQSEGQLNHEDNNKIIDESSGPLYSNVPTETRIQRSIYNVPDKIKIQIDQLQQILIRRRHYIKTRQFDDIVAMMSANNSVVISGRPGEGKTSAALELMNTYRGRGKCIQIKDPDDVNFLQPNIYDFVFIDDIFGIHELDESRKQRWIPVLHTIQNLLDADSFKVIIASREIVLKQCEHETLPFKLFSNKVLLSSENLDALEKKKILKASIELHEKHLSETDINTCILKCTSDIGFPYMCFLFASNEEFFREKEAFFKRYLVIDNNMLQQLKVDKLWALWFLWTKGGCCSTDKLFESSKENMHILKQIAIKRNIEPNISNMITKVKDNLRYMENVFVLNSNETYTFLHNTIYQSVGLYFANNGFIETVVSSCNIDFFMECFCLQLTKEKRIIYLSENEIPLFLDRIFREITQNNHCREVSVHPCLTFELLQKLLCLLLKTKSLETVITELLLTNHSDANRFLKKVVSRKKCTGKHLFSLKECQLCLMYSEIYKAACRSANKDALETLHFVKFDITMMTCAIKSKNIEIVEIVSRRIKNIKELDQQTINTVLDDVVDSDDYNIFEVICRGFNVKQSAFRFRCIYIAANKKQYNILEQLLKLKFTPFQYYINKTKEEMEDKKVYFALAKHGYFPSVPDFHTYIRNGKLDLCLCIINDLQNNEKPDNIMDKHFRYSAKKSSLFKDINKSRSYWQNLGLYEQQPFITECINTGKIDQIKTLIEYRIRMKALDPNETWVKYTACHIVKHSTEIYLYLLENGFHPDNETLRFVVATGNEDSIARTIEVMKANENHKHNPYLNNNIMVALESLESLCVYNILLKSNERVSDMHLSLLIKSKMPGWEQSVIDIIKALKQEKYDFKESIILKDTLYECVKSCKDIYNMLREEHIVLPDNAIYKSISDSEMTKDDMAFVISETKQQNVHCLFNMQEFESHLCKLIYKPDVFNLLLDSFMDPYLTKYRVLFGVRTRDLHCVKEAVEQLKLSEFRKENLVLQLASLEAKQDQLMYEYLESEGILVTDLIDKSIKTLDYKLVHYICDIMEKQKELEVDYPSTETILLKTIDNFSMYSYMLDNGIIPTMNCLEVAIQYGARSGLKTIDCIVQNGIWDNANGYAVSVLKKAVEQSNINCVKMIMGGIRYASELINLEEFEEKLMEMSISCFPIYELLNQHGFKTTSGCILNAVVYSNIKEFKVIVNNYISYFEWSLSDHKLNDAIIYAKKARKNVLDIMTPYQINPVFSLCMDAVRTENTERLSEIFESYHELRKDLIPKVLEQLCTFRYLRLEQIKQVLWNQMHACDMGFSTCQVLKSVITNNEIELEDIMSYFVHTDISDMILQLSVEESFFINKPILFKNLLDNGLKTTPYCLYLALLNENNDILEQIFNQMASDYETLQSQYFTMSLSICCKRNDMETLRTFINRGIRPTTEHLYEAVVIFENETIGHFILDNLIENGAWNNEDYWTYALIKDTNKRSVK